MSDAWKQYAGYSRYGRAGEFVDIACCGNDEAYETRRAKAPFYAVTCLAMSAAG